MVHAVIEAEAPIKDDVLAQRVARAHGWLRTGARIRTDRAPSAHLGSDARIHGHVSLEAGHRGGAHPVPGAASPDHRRSVADIALAELTDLVLRHSDALEEDDPPLIYARLMQIDRLETHFAAAETARLKPG